MAIEIERKFLVAGDAWRAEAMRSARMAQGYLVGAAALGAGLARASVRVRLAGGDAWLNIKSATLGIERQEYELALPPEDAERMLATLCDGVIEKIRHYVPIADFTFEVDEFLGANAGLVVAELELPHADAAYPRPPWLGREVSAEARYYNVNLIRHPYARWSAAEREESPAC
ncbi:MAG TPA: CYTH domain-containing protein [Mizugakiibacter sp.]